MRSTSQTEGESVTGVAGASVVASGPLIEAVQMTCSSRHRAPRGVSLHVVTRKRVQAAGRSVDLFPATDGGSEPCVR